MHHARHGFTLIELSIVLVIIGLIVGGVLVGRDLIAAATIRAQITQIEKIQTAVNTFRGKFNALPGDMNVQSATQFGFDVTGCDGTTGMRNGDFNLVGTTGLVYGQGGGETGLFWKDLSSAAAGNLIEGSYSLATCTSTPTLSATQISQYMPAAKIGSNFVDVYFQNSFFGYATKNYFNIINVPHFVNGNASAIPGMSVAQAWAIDAKIDDALATTGSVWVAYNSGSGMFTSYATTPDTAITCYNSATNAYSISFNNGSGINCAISLEIK